MFPTSFNTWGGIFALMASSSCRSSEARLRYFLKKATLSLASSAGSSTKFACIRYHAFHLWIDKLIQISGMSSCDGTLDELFRIAGNADVNLLNCKKGRHIQNYIFAIFQLCRLDPHVITCRATALAPFGRVPMNFSKSAGRCGSVKTEM